MTFTLVETIVPATLVASHETRPTLSLGNGTVLIVWKCEIKENPTPYASNIQTLFLHSLRRTGRPQPVIYRHHRIKEFGIEFQCHNAQIYVFGGKRFQNDSQNPKNIIQNNNLGTYSNPLLARTSVRLRVQRYYSTNPGTSTTSRGFWKIVGQPGALPFDQSDLTFLI